MRCKVEKRYLLVVIDEECCNTNMMGGSRRKHGGQIRNPVDEHDVSCFSMTIVEPLLIITTLEYQIMAMEGHIGESNAISFAVIEM